MEFFWPMMLWSLALVPVLVGVYILMQRRRKRYALRFGSLSLVKEALGRGPGWRRHVPPALFLLGLAVMLVALARPSTVVTMPSNEGTVILTMDASGSMRADDVLPSRLDAAKAAARAFIAQQRPGVKVGVVSFSDSAFVVQAPTSDKQELLAAINRLNTQRGTAIGTALLTSVDAIFEDADLEGGRPLDSAAPTPTPMPKGMYAPAIIVLLSDGQSNRGPHPLDVIDQVVARGVRVYTVGLGTPEGTVLRNVGRSMRVRLDETTLKAIAEATDGAYYNASTAADLEAVYRKLGLRIEFRKQQTEVTAFFTGFALLVLLGAGVLSLLWFNRVL